MIADWPLNRTVNRAAKPLILKAIFALLLLGGCVAKPVPLNPGVDFRVSGKFGIRDGREGYSARFSWQQSMDAYDIEVWGPLGQGRTQLRGDSLSMAVFQGGEVLTRGAPEDVMAASLGWSVPVAVLPAWIRGMPHRQVAHAAAVRDDQGRYTEFVQADWRVELSRYERSVDGATPGRIVAENGARRVTVLVRDYTENDVLIAPQTP